ncbi:helix-turn-helix transcriptional regulator [Actinoallomurus sp. NPDC052308]|uniref:helix-turn-helix transcriptional regulator n=1 Tax=Actinoallomurus sp. NPDC052308 TaxID=3155530 RepID=UPI00341B5F5D
MTEPVELSRAGLTYLTGGAPAYAGRYVHARSHVVHTHSFLEIAVVVGGVGVHHSPAGRRDLRSGDVMVLRPGVWHGYERCRDLALYNCCVSTGLLQHELSWTREDPLLGHLLWTGPMSAQRRGTLSTTLDPAALKECTAQLRELSRLGPAPDRGAVIGRLLLFTTRLARAVAAAEGVPAGRPPTHPAAVRAMRLLESRPAHAWTLAELAGELHITPSHLVRVFKTATGLPPMAYLSRLRAEIAASLLLRTAQPITQISRSVGWPDQNYFARRFKAHFGLTATAYRQRFAEQAPLPLVPREPVLPDA